MKREASAGDTVGEVACSVMSFPVHHFRESQMLTKRSWILGSFKPTKISNAIVYHTKKPPKPAVSQQNCSRICCSIGCPVGTMAGSPEG